MIRILKGFSPMKPLEEPYFIPIKTLVFDHVLRENFYQFRNPYVCQ